MSADPLGASRARAARPGGELALGEVVTAVEYDIVGQRDGRFAQVRSAVATIDLARTDVNTFAHVNREITRHVTEGVNLGGSVCVVVR